jgi:hypothetical protein
VNFRLLSVTAFVLLVTSGLGLSRVSAQPVPVPTISPAPLPAGSPAAAAPTPTPTAFPYVVTTSAPLPVLNLQADTIEFLFNRYRVEADGHVSVKLGDATLTGDTFSMDLRLNRMIVAGHVHLQAGSIGYDGAAFSEFFDDDRGYFLPVFTEPDRWTFIGRNYGLPYLGRSIPYDAFQLPNIAGESIFLYATSATIWPRDALLFHGSRVNVLGLRAPGGTIYLNFSQNFNFHQNSLVGAQADIGYPFQGGRWQYTTLHVRYDPVIKTYLALEQHFAWDNAYVVFSLAPFDRAQKQYNLMASDRFTRNFQLSTFQQLNVEQYGWTRPNTASSFSNYNATYALPHSFFNLSYNLWNYGLSTTSAFLDVDHPTSTTLTWNGFDHRIGLLPFYFRLNSGVSNAEDTYGIGTFNGTPMFNLWSTTYGATLYTSPFKLFKDTYLNGIYSRQMTFYSEPHHLDTATTTISVSHSIGTKANASVTYQVTNNNDYAGVQQLALYPSTTPVNPSTGLPALGYAAFIGLSTSRTLSYAFAYTPTANFVLNVTYQHYRDFPEPVGLVLGRPPNFFNIDMRFRLTQQLSLELQRAYYFNWYGAKWAPAFGIQFGP